VERNKVTGAGRCGERSKGESRAERSGEDNRNEAERRSQEQSEAERITGTERSGSGEDNRNGAERRSHNRSSGEEHE